MKNIKYIMYPGRFQSPHIGHMHIFNESLKEGKHICIAIRDIEPDESNPFYASEVKDMWEMIYEGNELVKVIIIPDIEAINYGRGVGYSINEIQVPNHIANISATDIRNQIKEGNSGWKTLVNERIWNYIESKLKK